MQRMEAVYAMVSVGPARVDDVKADIEGQIEHHRKQTFQEEFRTTLNRYGIEYNEEYIWDWIRTDEVPFQGTI